MKAINKIIIEALQAVVSLHLTAIEQYTGQAKHFSRWGYSKLASAAEADAKEEQEHLAKLLSRLEEFDTQPVFTHDAPSYPQKDLLGILASNMALETKAAQAESQAVLQCREAGDEITAKIFADNLEGSEEAIVKIEAMQSQIADMTLQNFLSAQV